MNPLKNIILGTLVMLCGASCSVISEQVRKEAEPAVPFKTLVEKGDSYAGKTVILGGYVLAARGFEGETILTVLQTPLSLKQKPGSKERSEGRFVVSLKALSGSEMEYYLDRRVTIAGKVAGFMDGRIKSCPEPCLKIKSRELYVWRESESHRVYDPAFYATEMWDMEYPPSWYP
jgi:starvation-inducible outer membrane lipoprotein